MFHKLAVPLIANCTCCDAEYYPVNGLPPKLPECGRCKAAWRRFLMAVKLPGVRKGKIDGNL